jgi:Asp-tRNA(Asn)/Glu-tRNA(Gln) amidotransferase A subunit family amidase
MDSLSWLPAWRLEELIRAREVSPVEVTRDVLDRVGRLDGTLHAFITVMPEDALAAARRAEDAVQRGEELGPLHGIPVSLKDSLWTRGMRTTDGSRIYQDFVPEEDSIAAERIRCAGGIIFGKTNLPEFALFRRTMNLLVAECLNPWDIRRTSGGSSGGAAVATAAGLGPIAIGTDGGGSIRIPSSWNGVFGLLPSRGRIPGFGHMGATFGSGIGPITRDVRDAAMVLAALSGPDARWPGAIQGPVPDFLAALDEGVGGMRMAWTPDFGYIRPKQAEVVAVVARAVEKFVSLGAVVEEPALRLEDPWDLFAPTHYLDEAMSRELEDPANAAFAPSPEHGEYGALPELARALADPVKRRLLAPTILHRDNHPTQFEYSLAIPPAVRTREVDQLQDVFSRYDLLLSPVISEVAPVCEEANLVPWTYTEYTMMANKAGYPAASIPCGWHNGLPVGLQVLGKRNEELTVLRACRAFEVIYPFADRHPDLV